MAGSSTGSSVGFPAARLMGGAVALGAAYGAVNGTRAAAGKPALTAAQKLEASALETSMMATGAALAAIGAGMGTKLSSKTMLLPALAGASAFIGMRRMTPDAWKAAALLGVATALLPPVGLTALGWTIGATFLPGLLNVARIMPQALNEHLGERAGALFKPASWIFAHWFRIADAAVHAYQPHAPEAHQTPEAEAAADVASDPALANALVHAALSSHALSSHALADLADTDDEHTPAAPPAA